MFIYFLVHPYIIDDNLKKIKKQPKELKNVKWFERNEFATEEWFRGMVREDALQRTCNRELRGNYTDNFKCHFLHHFNPYLKLGPFKLEVKLDKPYRTILHDMLTEKEIQHMIDISVPNLSRTRGHSASNEGSRSEFRYGDKKYIIHKTVQHWFSDVLYDGSKVRYTSVAEEGPTNTYFDDLRLDYIEGYDKYEVIDPVMFKLTKKLEMASQMDIMGKFSSTSYQVRTHRRLKKL